MCRGATEQRFAPCLEPREFLDMAEPSDPVEKDVARSNGTGICSAALS
jgi:hypothetical protein